MYLMSLAKTRAAYGRDRFPELGVEKSTTHETPLVRQTTVPN